MKKILVLLATDGAFLYEKYDCRIVDSKYCAAFGGAGHVTLSSDVVELKFWFDQDKLFLSLRGKGLKSHLEWHSIDIIRQLLTGSITDDALASRENVRWTPLSRPKSEFY